MPTPPPEAWVVRALVVDGEVVGHAGFHGPPDATGTVEVGCTVVPERRGRGHAHGALQALLAHAAASGPVRVVRAGVSPDTAPSLAVVRRAGVSGGPVPAGRRAGRAGAGPRAGGAAG